MSTLQQNKRPFRRVFIPTNARAMSVEFTEDMMQVTLTDGRILGIPLAWFPTLREATPEQRANVEISGGGTGLHWPDIDEDLNVANLLAGGDRRSV